MDTNKVLALAAKLLAMQENRGATEVEASFAAEKLQQLLQDHNLTMSQVEANNGSNDQGATRVKNEVKMNAITVRSEQWRLVLFDGIARNNFCLAHLKKDLDKGTQHTVLVGREINVNVTKMTYDYLSRAFIQAAKTDGLTPHHTTRKNYTYFMDGAVSRVTERLDERRREREREDTNRANTTTGNGTGKELVLSDVYGSEADLNNDTLNNFPPGTTAAKRRETAERQQRQKLEHDRLVAEGVDDTVAWYRAFGYSETVSAEAAKQWKKTNRNHKHSSTSWSRRSEAEYRKVNSASYQKGRQTGSNIGLDAQVGADTVKRIK